MRNFKMLVEYDGTDFHGWQRQPNLRTVQGTMEEALEAILGTAVQVNGAGRTDTGVHALGQTCSTVLDTALTPARLRGAIGSKLPEDIQVYRVSDVDMKFHARFSARSRRYSYYLRTEPTAIWRRFAYVVTTPLNVDDMQAAAAHLMGERDFTSFTPSRSTGVPAICDVRAAEVERHDEVISITLEADHFLHHMVRVIVGTLIEVGRGKYPPEHLEDILCRRDRTAAGPTIPPNGLFLTGVRYGD
ncbi:MAG: tRNA pseudouridine(38-40) synthase TruA [Candidatus Krumholzibacteriia bacterium]